jgi:hypothetical protein
VFQAACRLAGSLGTIIKLDLAADLPMDERNKWVGRARCWWRAAGLVGAAVG